MHQAPQLAALRAAARLSQREMAARLNTSQSWICRLEATPEAASYRSVRRYLNALGYELTSVPALNLKDTSL
jgi:transcriptional regulator with XRE-family HTH domain